MRCDDCFDAGTLPAMGKCQAVELEVIRLATRNNQDDWPRITELLHLVEAFEEKAKSAADTN